MSWPPSGLLPPTHPCSQGGVKERPRALGSSLAHLSSWALLPHIRAGLPLIHAHTFVQSPHPKEPTVISISGAWTFWSCCGEGAEWAQQSICSQSGVSASLQTTWPICTTVPICQTGRLRLRKNMGDYGTGDLIALYHSAAHDDRENWRTDTPLNIWA